METEKSAEGFTLYEIQKDDENLIDPVLLSTGVVSNFTCFQQFYAFLRKPTNHLYLCDSDGQKRILLYRTAGINDVRILFSRLPDDEKFIEAIKTHFQPQYLAYNLIPQKPDDLTDVALREDLIIDVKTVADLQDSKIRADFNKCKRLHPNLQYRPAEITDKERIEKFLDEWCVVASEKFGAKMTAENDRRFLELFLGTDKIKGEIVFDGDRVIGIAFHTVHPSDPALAVNVILKNLRGYNRLGEWLTVQHARQLKEEGFCQALIGGTEVERQAHFKRKFIREGVKNTYYSGEVYSSPNLSLSENYLRDFWA